MKTQYREFWRQRTRKPNHRLIWLILVLMLSGTVEISFVKSGNDIRLEIQREQKLPIPWNHLID